MAGKAVLAQSAAGPADELPLLARIDRLLGGAVAVSAAGADLHEAERVALARDDVDFDPPAAQIAREDLEAVRPQVLRGELLPPGPERLAIAAQASLRMALG